MNTKAAIGNRLLDLHNWTRDDPDVAGIDLKSLKGFLDNVLPIKNLEYPDIMVSPDGNIICHLTRAEKGRWHALEFLPDGRIAYAKMESGKAEKGIIECLENS